MSTAAMHSAVAGGGGASGAARAETAPATGASNAPATSATTRPLSRPKGRVPRKSRHIAQLLLDRHQPVILLDAFAARERSRLDLPGTGGNRQVGNRRVRGFAGAVRDDAAVSGLVRGVDAVQRFGERAD